MRAEWLSTVRETLLRDPLQLVLDDELIERRAGLTRRLGTVFKYDGNPVVTPSTSADVGGAFAFGTAIRDEGMFRLWYYGLDRAKTCHFCYADSDDGVEWRKVPLGRVMHQGSRQNNILLSCPAPNTLHNLSVVKHVNDDSKRRYAAALFMRPPADILGPLRGSRIVFSADGTHWTEPDHRPNVRCNETGALLYDEQRTDFVDLNKLEDNEDDPSVPRWEKVRNLAVATSPDGYHWSRYEVRMRPDPAHDGPHDEIYGMSGFRYGGHYVGMVRVFHNTPKAESGTEQCIDLQLAASRDGVHWQRICPGDVFIPIGQPGQWDFARIAPHTGPAIRVGDELRYYYTGQPARHTGGPYKATIGFLTLRPDGFCSLEAGENQGELLTRPRVADRPFRIAVNVDARAGCVHGELLDASGRVLPEFAAKQCHGVTGDTLDTVLRWGAHDVVPRGTEVKLRLLLQCAKLYSLRFEVLPGAG